MVHGFFGSHHNFQKLTNLMTADYRIIRVDLPGFGLSDFPAGEENYAAMYQDFLAEFVSYMDLKDYYLVGISMCGGISCMMAEHYPENMKGLILQSLFL